MVRFRLMGLVTLLAVVLVFVLAAGVVAGGPAPTTAAPSPPAPASAPASVLAQSPDGEPAFLSFVNPSATTRTVQLRTISVAGQVLSVSTHVVEGTDVVTVALAPGTAPQTFRFSCSGCRGLTMSLADGQRLVVPLLTFSDAASVRSDLHVVNESGRRQQGALRVGLAAGTGRSVLRFDLRPGGSARVGIRVPGAGALSFNLTCDGCAPQFARAANGVDLELVIR